MHLRHPSDAFCRLDVGLGGKRIWIIKRRRLDINNPRQKCGVAVKQPRAAVLRV
jgi:hypothetical protein